MIIKLIEKTKNIFIKNNYSLESFRRYNNISRRKSYKKIKDSKGEEMLSNKEKALKTAQIKREKSINVIKEVLEILVKNEKKTTSKNVYEIIKNDFNDCLKLTQIKTYLKQIKDLKN